MKYIIDGYNLIHGINRLGASRLRSQREGLIRLLENAQRQDRRLKDLTVVFDGRADVYAPRINSAVKVIFTKGITADQKIKEILQSSSFSRDIGVVSDDRQIRFYAGSHGAKKVSLKDFLKMVFYSTVEDKGRSFKLAAEETKAINQELAEIWLKR